MKAVAVAAVIVAFLGMACGSDREDRVATEESGSPAPECGRFVVFERSDWTFKEAIDYPADIGDWPEPHLDWYAEFSRLVPISDDMRRGESLRISGFDVGVAGVKAQLPPTATLEKRPGGILVASGLEGGKTLVIKRVRPDYTLTFFGGDVGVDELVTISSEARPVCEQEWLDSGGQILDCMPTEPGCVTEF